MKQFFVSWLMKTALFLAKGELLMWAFTVNIIAMGWYAQYHGNKKPMDSGIVTAYCTALTIYVGKKGWDQYQATKQSKVTKIQEAGDV
ncbi:MAG: hypothetical protein C4586_08795 [Anaerolineaceae bacterium]|nr:MAG: hypothetical protein C4586_08795 [Anaerolineaceae bacterium]